MSSLAERPQFPREQFPCSGFDTGTLRVHPPTVGPVPGGPGEGPGQRPLPGGRGGCHLALQAAPVSVWIGTLGCIDIWEELDTHHGEREINKSSPYSSAILFGDTLIRHPAENIYNILP